MFGLVQPQEEAVEPPCGLWSGGRRQSAKPHQVSEYGDLVIRDHDVVAAVVIDLDVKLGRQLALHC